MKKVIKRNVQQKRTIYKKKAMISALKTQLGNVSKACKQVKLAQKTHYEWLKVDKEYNNQVQDVFKETVDFVVSKLFENIEDCNQKAIEFFLKTKGGFVERQIIESKNLNIDLDINKLQEAIKNGIPYK